jgi:hypothetical protein
MDTGHESANSFAKSFVLILVLAFGLVGCSSTKVAYRYADWGIVWWVEDYVSLTADQKQQLNNDSGIAVPSCPVIRPGWMNSSLTYLTTRPIRPLSNTISSSFSVSSRVFWNGQPRSQQTFSPA